MTEWEVGEADDLPPTMLFPDDSSIAIRFAKDVPSEVTRWLWDNGHLIATDLPIMKTRKTALVDTTKEGMRQADEVRAGIFVYTSAAAPVHVGHALQIIRHAYEKRREA